MENKNERGLARLMASMAIVALLAACGRSRLTAKPQYTPGLVDDSVAMEDRTPGHYVPDVYILSLDSGVDKDSVAADVRMIGGTVIYSYASFNMMAIKIPHSMTIEDAIRAMPSFRGNASPDQMCELDDTGVSFH